MKFHRDLPAYAINGIAVALGIGLIQLVIGSVAGALPAQLALSGAVCASLSDVPNTVSRTWNRVPVAALLGFVSAMLVALLKPYPVALGFGIAAMVFVAMLMMSWGARAGAVSFAPILALVFAMALPAASEPPLHVLAAWNALGGLGYVGWSLFAGRALEQRYRALALADSLSAAATLLRARATLMTADAADASAKQGWIKGEAELAERLQTARDFVFAQPDGIRARRDTAIALHTIELRDVLLASRLDLDLLGSDAAGQWVLGQTAAALRQLGSALDAAALAVRHGRIAAPLVLPEIDFSAHFSAAPLPPGDARARLLPAVVDRLHSLAGDVRRIHALLRGETEPLPLTRTQLQRFVAPEGWPLGALAAQRSWRSPVLRHAVRSALALGSAYFIALALPWASHPHWLVLSVAVVLRGSLEQTLARRNGRVLGTMLGCVAVVGLARLHSPLALSLCFLLAVAIAHAFVLQRYWLTASAATVMALLQAYLVHPAGGFAIPERVADTVLGAALAWAFSYVLPSWERAGLPNAIKRLLQDLDAYARHALAVQPGNAADAVDAVDAVEQRLARRRAYDALAALASALQRSSAEPAAVRLPVDAVTALVDHGQRLMAHLSLVRMTLSQRGADLPAPAAALALAEAGSAVSASLGLSDAGRSASQGDTDLHISPDLPAGAPSLDVMPWLRRRLQVLTHDARRIELAARQVLKGRAA